MRILLILLITFLTCESSFAEDNSIWCEEAEKGFDALLRAFSENYSRNPNESIQKLKKLSCTETKHTDAIPRLLYVLAFIEKPLFENPLDKLPEPWMRDSSGYITVDPIAKEALISAAAECFQDNGKHCKLEKMEGGQNVAFKKGKLFLKLGYELQFQDQSESMSHLFLKLVQQVFIGSINYLFNFSYLVNDITIYARIRDYISEHKIQGIRIPLIEMGFDARIPKFKYQIAQNLSDEGTSFEDQQTSRMLDIYQTMDSIPSLRAKVQGIFNNFAEVVYNTGLGDIKYNNVTLGWGGISIVDFDLNYSRNNALANLFKPSSNQFIRQITHWSLFQKMREHLEKIKDKDDFQNYLTLGQEDEIRQRLLDACKMKAWSLQTLTLEDIHCPTVFETLQVFLSFGGGDYRTPKEGETSLNNGGLEKYLKGLSGDQIHDAIEWFMNHSTIHSYNFNPYKILEILIKIHKENTLLLNELLEKTRILSHSESKEKRKLGLKFIKSITQIKNLHAQLQEIWIPLVEKSSDISIEDLLLELTALWEEEDFSKEPILKSAFERATNEAVLPLLSALLNSKKQLSIESGRLLLQGMEKIMRSDKFERIPQALEYLDSHFVKGNLISEAKHIIDLLSSKLDTGCDGNSTFNGWLLDFFKKSTSTEIKEYLAKGLLEKCDLIEQKRQGYVVNILCKHADLKPNPCSKQDL